ncbi:sulfur carrier protein ThiS [Sanguibacter suaedae]|uniref:Sulfur carrier protein ThiS n=1 Tax=Sanguibacter suaedae TaxID=2795737 RepID=A0A934IAC7_9MICO|nr:sulfur carrier protein ThiS [Sanguibacter suaedae]MBI9114120.1 sulfur carrier protein ThiS [Sanguibacter suaedae]
MTTVHVNGVAHDLQSTAPDVASLVARFVPGVADAGPRTEDEEASPPLPAGVAVAVNDRVVPRSRWRSTHVVLGDRVEIVTAVQGG